MKKGSRDKKHYLKKTAMIALALGAAGVAGTSQAATTSGTFNVNITLTSVCTMSAIAPVAFSYTSNQVAPAPATGGGYSVTCTTGLPYDVSLQAGTGGAYPGLNPTINVTDGVTQLNYTLGTTGPTAAGGGTGTGVAQNYVINGSMAGSQVGCGGPSCAAAANNVHTLWLNY